MSGEEKPEVITSPVSATDVDHLAERVFQECINILGGLRKLTYYRNLTWLPSLAVASYAIVLKEELLKTQREIAEKLGITPQTVKNILQADEEEVKRFIKGEIEKVDEHKAGGIAKLAYRKVKEERGVFIREDELEVLGVDWALRVLIRLRGADFPLDKEALEKRLEGIIIKGKHIDQVIEKMKFPVRSPAEVLKQIKDLTS
ncbi:KaiC associated regulatory domain-containing protein [Candidatus Bathyarchaeota archaeon B24-2]|nr:MAG: KaiC associated regulatory domain-containing protein [Candidatus Bathyarchaeota archaeon B24-2]